MNFFLFISYPVSGIFFFKLRQWTKPPICKRLSLGSWGHFDCINKEQITPKNLFHLSHPLLGLGSAWPLLDAGAKSLSVRIKSTSVLHSNRGMAPSPEQRLRQRMVLFQSAHHPGGGVELCCSPQLLFPACSPHALAWSCWSTSFINPSYLPYCLQLLRGACPMCMYPLLWVL